MKFLSIFVFIVMISVVSVVADVPPGVQLAIELSEEGDHKAAAIEYRRLALGVEEPQSQATWYWLAAYEYGQTDQDAPVSDLLDNAEDAWPELEREAVLLRAENARRQRDWSEAEFYYGSLAGGSDTSEDMRRYARLQRITMLLRDGAVDKACAQAENSDIAVQTAVEAYRTGRDKKPWLGGLLGIIPGLGYLYAGEWDNAIRSLILNSIFIYGMVDTAHDDEWGFFTVITFFEITWYTGSIYGGIDATHRYNRDRLESCIDAVEGSTSFWPDLNQVPVLYLNFSF